MSTPNEVVADILAAKTPADFWAIYERHRAYLLSNEFFWRAFITPALLKPSQEADPRDVTLATIREVVGRELSVPEPVHPMAIGPIAAGNQWQVRGRRAAMCDIQAILDAHGKAAGEPVHLGGAGSCE